MPGSPERALRLVTHRTLRTTTVYDGVTEVLRDKDLTEVRVNGQAGV